VSAAPGPQRPRLSLAPHDALRKWLAGGRIAPVRCKATCTLAHGFERVNLRKA
jgi:hypothetical protein